MVLVDIDENELKALDVVFKDAKVSIDTGAILFRLKMKIIASFKAKMEKQKADKNGTKTK